jgi:methylmalonyl-CoA mutase, C-terminal domain
MTQQQRIRVLVGKPGLDGHDRGAKVIARALRDAGMEVIYTGLRQTPAMIAETALQEDVDVVGLSILSGAHLTLVPTIRAALDEADMDDVPLILGGIIPQADHTTLYDAGVAAIFGPGTDTREIVSFVQTLIENRGARTTL